MARDFTIEIDRKKLLKALREVPRELFNEMKIAFRDILVGFEAKFVSTRLSGRPGLNRRSGALARSFRHTIRGGNLDTLEGVVFTDTLYAPIHEFGGIIRPRNSRYLAIPLPFSGAAAMGAEALRRPRDYPDGFFVRTKAGNLVFGVSEGDSFIPLFLLKESVTIPPRMGFIDLWDSMKSRNVQRINTGIARALKKGTSRG